MLVGVLLQNKDGGCATYEITRSYAWLEVSRRNLNHSSGRDVTVNLLGSKLPQLLGLLDAMQDWCLVN